MCGISGYVAINTNINYAHTLKAMTDVIAHRGPDGEGHWYSDHNVSIGFGHRRLSIIDLSAHANQPMHYGERYTIVFNGEIYNYIELRDQLLKQGYSFSTQSDTEVLLAMYDKYGEECLKYLDGMFAFAIFDAVQNTIFFARDRFGEKPLFYAQDNYGTLFFASEIKCLFAAGIERKVSHRMLYNYMSFQSLEDPLNPTLTFFEGIYKMPPSQCSTVKVNKGGLLQQIQNTKQYYNIEIPAERSVISVDNAKQQFRELFYESLKRRIRSDVPVGSSLSGGLDSSLVVTALSKFRQPNQVQATFSAIFPGFEKDESVYIKKIVEATGVTPHYVTPNEDHMLQELQTLFWHQEEPFVSASIYVQYAVMRLAKQQGVVVLLDGQGADEILAGYHHYYVPFFNELKRRSPREYKKQLTAYKTLHASNTINNLQLGNITSKFKATFPNYLRFGKAVKHHWQQFTTSEFHRDYYKTYSKDLITPIDLGMNDLTSMLKAATTTLGLQQLLRYADRNSMAHSREVRLPFLSHHLIDFLFTLPSEYKINNGWTKWLMREAFPELHADIAWRKDKIGYEPPQKQWLASPVMKSLLATAQKTLVSHKIINSKFADGSKKVSTSEQAWRQLMAAFLLNG